MFAPGDKTLLEGKTPLLDRVSLPADLRRLKAADLPALAAELRADVLRTVAQTGGHMGAGLGVVELTLALHYLMDTPNDRLLWDVGHQVYPHKIITGRRARMHTLRQEGGLSGFTLRTESPYDAFGAGHSSTSISAAMGMATALKNTPQRVVAVIGDGALTAGMAYEALNHAGDQKTPMLVVFNDNGMSIAPNVGALNISPSKEAFFTTLGCTYMGPVDGHDFGTLLPALDKALTASNQGPVVLHVKTIKGYGWAPAETQLEKGHATNPFDLQTGKSPAKAPTAPAYTEVFARQFIVQASQDDKLAVISAGMPSGTGVDKVAAVLPAQAFDTGIAEQHAVTFAAGLACEGYKPFVAIYSTFLQRAYDQLIHDVALQNLPVRFVLDRAGLVGADGATHNGAFDIAYLSAIPNMVLMAPADEAELVHMTATAAAHNSGPIAMRIPRGAGTGVALPACGQVLPIGKGRIIQQGQGVAFVTFGTRLGAALGAAQRLEELGMQPTVIDARFAKPLDTELLAGLAQNHSVVITAEEGSSGGFGSSVLGFYAQSGLLGEGFRVYNHHLPDVFIEHGDVTAAYARTGLDGASLAAAALQALGRPPQVRAVAQN